ncbi:hypothetical protein HPB52_016761 [Rhipicephalus sanguineus]|uniref:Uncharacterized protein n=1 Tax=Rhipicephalus sanguineus TaxID=34632 RepID=A0A9D4Q7M4_RHISA|nr:hypothetical protein HPB52_016761 [Rhipicephalus sanguineus]
MLTVAAKLFPIFVVHNEPKRALLLFIVWSITTSPASVGTDMVYNYYSSGGNTDLFIMNAVIRCSIEAAKFYVLYRFYRLYNRLGAEERPIVVEGTAAGASPTVLAVTASGGGARTTAAEAKESRTGAAHFRRRTPYGAGPVPTKSVMATDAASDDPSLHGHSATVVQGSTALVAQHGLSYRRRSTSSHPSDIGQDAAATTDGGGLGQNVEYKPGNDLHLGADLGRAGSRKQSYEFGGSSGSAKASPTNAASDTSSPVSSLSGKPQRRPGRRLSIVSPTHTAMHVANVLQPVPETAPLPDGNAAVAVVQSSPASASVRSILRNQQDGLPSRLYQNQHQKTGKEEHVTKPLAAREDVAVLMTAEGVAAPERTLALQRQGRRGSTPSYSPDRSAAAKEGVMSHEETSMTTTSPTTTRRREDRKSKAASKGRSRSGERSKTRSKSSKHLRTSPRTSSLKKTSSPSSPEESTALPSSTDQEIQTWVLAPDVDVIQKHILAAYVVRHPQPATATSPPSKSPLPSPERCWNAKSILRYPARRVNNDVVHHWGLPPQKTLPH